MNCALAVLEAAAGADAVVMAAAVADFRPVTTASSKIKKTDADALALELTRTPDVLAELARTPTRPAKSSSGSRPRPTTRSRTAARSWPPRAPTCSWSTKSGATKGFEVADNAATILHADGGSTEVPTGPKAALADAVWDLVAARLAPAHGSAPHVS